LCLQNKAMRMLSSQKVEEDNKKLLRYYGLTRNGQVDFENKRYGLAINHFKKAKELYPYDIKPYGHLASIYYILENAKEAHFYFEKALLLAYIYLDSALISQLLYYIHYNNTRRNDAKKQKPANIKPKALAKTKPALPQPEGEANTSPEGGNELEPDQYGDTSLEEELSPEDEVSIVNALSHYDEEISQQEASQEIDQQQNIPAQEKQKNIPAQENTTNETYTPNPIYAARLAIWEDLLTQLKNCDTPKKENRHDGINKIIAIAKTTPEINFSDTAQCRKRMEGITSIIDECTWRSSTLSPWSNSNLFKRENAGRNKEVDLFYRAFTQIETNIQYYPSIRTAEEVLIAQQKREAIIDLENEIERLNRMPARLFAHSDVKIDADYVLINAILHSKQTETMADLSTPARLQKLLVTSHEGKVRQWKDSTGRVLNMTVAWALTMKRGFSDEPSRSEKKLNTFRQLPDPRKIIKNFSSDNNLRLRV